MNGIEMLWVTSEVQAVSWALLHFVWQGALVGIAAAGALALLSKGRASARYGVALAALLIMTALPVVTALRLAGTPGADAPAVLAGDGAVSSRAGASPVPAAGVPKTLNGSSPLLASLPSALPWVFSLWLAGVAALSLYHLGGWQVVRRLRNRGIQPVSRELEDRLQKLARRMGIARAVGLVESSMLAVPAVIGCLRPVILVPASTLTGLSPRQLEAILAHELAHVRRHDYLVNLFQTVVETLLFYHPAVWWVSAQVRRERESCCDELAVAVCGDRLGYARALADLEGLRASSPGLAMAANGGSLAERIRRLLGPPARGSRRSWAAGMLAFTLIPMSFTFNFGKDPGSPGDSGGSSGSASAPGDQEAGRRGTWVAERKAQDGKIWFRFTQGSWSHSADYPAGLFEGFSTGSEVSFKLIRDAGTFHFQGGFDGDKGTGSFNFASNPAYVREMETLGYKVDSRIVSLAMHDVSRDYVRQMRETGYSKVAVDGLIKFRIHGVAPDFVRELQELGYQDLTPQQLVTFRIHDVTPELVRGLQELGYRDLTPQQLVTFSIHGVTPEFVRELQELGYRDLSAQQLVTFRIHGVDGAFIQKAAGRGFKNLTARELVQLKIQGWLDR